MGSSPRSCARAAFESWECARQNDGRQTHPQYPRPRQIAEIPPRSTLSLSARGPHGVRSDLPPPHGSIPHGHAPPQHPPSCQTSPDRVLLAYLTSTPSRRRQIHLRVCAPRTRPSTPTQARRSHHRRLWHLSPPCSPHLEC